MNRHLFYKKLVAVLWVTLQFLLLTGFTSTQPSQIAQKKPYDPWGSVEPDMPTPEKPLSNEPTGNFSTNAAQPIANVPRFDVTITKRPLRILFFDEGTGYEQQDGDVIAIRLNGRVIRNSLLLTSSGTVIDFQASLFRSGINDLRIDIVSGGSNRIATAAILFPDNQVVGPRRVVSVGVGLPFLIPTANVTLGFPQIALCRTNFRFPCRPAGNLSVFPETSQHVLEALGSPPSPITAPLLPGRTGNPLRASYPRLLTVDRGPNATARRNQSTSAYAACPLNARGQSQDRDEYPPAAFLENFGSAHIKCVESQDNRLSGSSFNSQLQNYVEFPGAPPEFIEQMDTIEFVILN